MKNVLITGATGNVGMAVLKSLSHSSHQLNISAGLRDLKKDSALLEGFGVHPVLFDFMNIETYADALKHCELVFLLRPPQISDVKKYFRPLIAAAKSMGVKHIVFLSVQGVENSKIIPHHKIEHLIVESKIPYTFLRPAYFMQNFNTTLKYDLVTNKQIFLPAGDAKFTLIDVKDIGAVASRVIQHPNDFINSAIELTAEEKLTFKEMTTQLSAGLGTTIRYKSPNLLHFFINKKKDGVAVMMILVMIMLHYFPRFQKEPQLTQSVEEIIGRKPNSFAQYISENKMAFSAVR